MKPLSKTALILIVIALLLSLFPAMQPSVSAATTPILSLSAYYADAAENPFFEYYLDPEIYGQGGPFTVSFEWKTDTLLPFDSNDPEAGAGFACIVGLVASSEEPQNQTNIRLKNAGRWTQSSFSFENVGDYHDVATLRPGNLLRFGLYKTRGTIYFKNIRIQDAAGNVVYNLDSDQAVRPVLTELEAQLVSECDISRISGSNWTAGQFGTGVYTALLTYYSDTPINTTVIVPHSANPFVISGDQQIKPVSRLRGSHGYRDNDIFMYGDGRGFSSRPWEEVELPEITLDQSIEIFKNTTDQIDEVDVYSPSFEGRKDMTVSDLASLAPGYYAIVFGASSCSAPSDGVQYTHSYQYAFALIVSDGKTPASNITAPTTIAPTTAKPTTKPQPCPTGHEFFNGFCMICLQTDPAYRDTTLKPGVDCPGRPTLPPATNQSTTANVTPTHPNSAVDIEVDEPDDDSIYFAAFGVLIAALSVASIILIVLICRKK